MAYDPNDTRARCRAADRRKHVEAQYLAALELAADMAQGLHRITDSWNTHLLETRADAYTRLADLTLEMMAHDPFFDGHPVEVDVEALRQAVWELRCPPRRVEQMAEGAA